MVNLELILFEKESLKPLVLPSPMHLYSNRRDTPELGGGAGRPAGHRAPPPRQQAQSATSSGRHTPLPSMWLRPKRSAGPASLGYERTVTIGFKVKINTLKNKAPCCALRTRVPGQARQESSARTCCGDRCRTLSGSLYSLTGFITAAYTSP